MVADLGNEEPPAVRKGAMGRRRRRRRESALVWWGGFAAIAVAAWLLQSWRLALLGLLLWCLYEFVMVPTICRVMTRQGFSCREPARGRLFACKPGHQQVKNDALWRLVGMRNPFRKRRGTGKGSGPGPGSGEKNRDTGVVVFSPVVRGRLAQTDRTLILLASAGTVVTLVGMVYGFE